MLDFFYVALATLLMICRRRRRRTCYWLIYKMCMHIHIEIQLSIKYCCGLPQMAFLLREEQRDSRNNRYCVNLQEFCFFHVKSQIKLSFEPHLVLFDWIFRFRYSIIIMIAIEQNTITKVPKLKEYRTKLIDRNV